MDKVSKIVLLITSVFIFSIFFTISANADEQISLKIKTRIYGADRYETATEVAKFGWGKTDYIVIATGEDYPDALAATPLAKKYNAPIFLVNNTDHKPLRIKELRGEDTTLIEIKNLQPKYAFVIGGEGAVSNDIIDTLEEYDIKCTRLSGKNRYETAIKIAEELGAGSNEIAVANANSYAEALSISSIAAAKEMPIILVDKDNIPDCVSNYIGSKTIDKSYILGGTDLISNGVETRLPDAERISGKDIYERNLNILKRFEKDINYENTFIATGKDFPDALAGSALAALTKSPIILADNINKSSASELINSHISNINQVIMLGGELVVPNSVLTENMPFKNLMSDIIEPTDNEYTHYNEINEPMDVTGKHYCRGYSMRDAFGPSKMVFGLDGKYRQVSGFIAVNDGSSMGYKIEIYGDDRLIGTYDLKPNYDPQELKINVEGIHTLVILKHDWDFSLNPENQIDLINVIIE